MGTCQEQSQKIPPKCCRKQQPSCTFPPRSIIYSRVTALKIGSRLTPAPRLSNSSSPTPQELSGLCQGLGCTREWTTPTPQPSLLLPTFSFPCCCLSCCPAQPFHSPGRGTPLELGAASMVMAQGKSFLQSWSTPSPSRTGGMKLRTPELFLRAEHGAVTREVGNSQQTELPNPLWEALGTGMWPSRCSQPWSSPGSCLLPAPESFASTSQTLCKAQRGC